VQATNYQQEPRIAHQGELLSRILLEPTTHFCNSDREPSERHANELQMKRIITHFLGDISFETSTLRKIADSLDQGRGQERSDSDSVESHETESHDATPTNDYSIDPLSTSTMRTLAILIFVFTNLT
jgi:hypothetical protein